MTNVLSRKQYVCRDHKTFVAIKMILVAAPANDSAQAHDTGTCGGVYGPMIQENAVIYWFMLQGCGDR